MLCFTIALTLNGKLDNGYKVRTLYPELILCRSLRSLTVQGSTKLYTFILICHVDLKNAGVVKGVVWIKSHSLIPFYLEIRHITNARRVLK